MSPKFRQDAQDHFTHLERTMTSEYRPERRFVRLQSPLPLREIFAERRAHLVVVALVLAPRFLLLVRAQLGLHPQPRPARVTESSSGLEIRPTAHSKFAEISPRYSRARALHAARKEYCMSTCESRAGRDTTSVARLPAR